MSGEIDRLEGQLPLPFESGEPPNSATRAWYEEVGEAAVSLGRMMRKPTEARPFVYEVRFDLLSLGRSVTRLIVKGFGESGSLITFHDATGFVDGIRGFEGRLRSGKVVWHPDTYPPKNYEERVKLYLSGEVYRLG